jgi:hypothetical protein
MRATGKETTTVLSELRQKASSWTSPIKPRSSLPSGNATLARHSRRCISMSLLFLCLETVASAGSEERNDTLGFLQDRLKPPATSTNRVQTLRAEIREDEPASQNACEGVRPSPEQIEGEVEIRNCGLIGFAGCVRVRCLHLLPATDL